MKKAFLIAMIAILTVFSLSCGKPDVGDPNEVAVVETNYGRFIIEFLPDDAPRHVANFKQLARQGFFDGTKIHRLVKDKSNKPVAIQGGDPNTISGDPATWGQGQPSQKTVNAEFSKTLKHIRGIVSAARRGNDDNSHTSQFFVCVSPEPQWDGKYSIFGRVIEGMNVVDSISRAPVWKDTDRPMDAVVVSRIHIAKRSEVASGE
jgi:cyclophilin family peptidyl-prolyl cis-trans isomerase